MKNEYKPLMPCKECGGLHYGSVKCPYLDDDPAGYIAAHQATKNKESHES